VIVPEEFFVLCRHDVAVRATVAGFGTFAGPVYVTEVVVTFESVPQVLPLQQYPNSVHITP